MELIVNYAIRVALESFGNTKLVIGEFETNNVLHRKSVRGLKECGEAVKGFCFRLERMINGVLHFRVCHLEFDAALKDLEAGGSGIVITTTDLDEFHYRLSFQIIPESYEILGDDRPTILTMHAREYDSPHYQIFSDRTLEFTLGHVAVGMCPEVAAVVAHLIARYGLEADGVPTPSVSMGIWDFWLTFDPSRRIDTSSLEKSSSVHNPVVTSNWLRVSKRKRDGLIVLFDYRVNDRTGLTPDLMELFDDFGFTLSLERAALRKYYITHAVPWAAIENAENFQQINDNLAVSVIKTTYEI